MEKYLTKTKRKLEKDDHSVKKKIKPVHPEKTSKIQSIPIFRDNEQDECVKEMKPELEQKRNVVDPSSRELEKVNSSNKNPVCKWRKLKSENLDCGYTQMYSAKEANQLLTQCEKELDYNTGKLAQVQIFGKWHDIPRKQVAHGEAGLSYTFSGNTVPARPWCPLLSAIRDRITELTGHDFNFVLINRYKDGHDHMGEHKDDEKDLVQGHPIASLTLGEARDFVFKHQDTRGKNATRQIPQVKIELQNGGLLMMNHPTNSFWYHSLPQRKKVHGVRINMTFRKMVVGRKK